MAEVGQKEVKMEQQYSEKWEQLERLTIVVPEDEYKLLAYAVQDADALLLLLEVYSYDQYRERLSELFKDPVSKNVFQQIQDMTKNGIQVTRNRLIKWMETNKSNNELIDYSACSEQMKVTEFEEQRFQQMYEKIAIRNEKQIAFEELKKFLDLTYKNEVNLFDALTFINLSLEINQAMPKFKIEKVSRILLDRNSYRALSGTKVTLSALMDQRKKKVHFLWATSPEVESAALYTIMEVLLSRWAENSLFIAGQENMAKISESIHHVCLKDRNENFTRHTDKSLTHSATMEQLESIFIFEQKLLNHIRDFYSTTFFIYDLRIFNIDVNDYLKWSVLLKSLEVICDNLNVDIYVLQTWESYQNTTFKDSLERITNVNFESSLVAMNSLFNVVIESDH